MRYYEDAPYMTDLNWSLLLGATVVTQGHLEQDSRGRPAGAAEGRAGRRREAARRHPEERREPASAAMQKAGMKVVPVASKDAWLKTAAGDVSEGQGELRAGRRLRRGAQVPRRLPEAAPGPPGAGNERR